MALTLDSDEVIVYEVRRHWFALAKKMFLPFILFFVPLFAYSFINALSFKFVAPGNVTVLFLFFFMIWSLLIWILIIIFWTDYYLDLMILTNKRLIRVEQNGLFSREISYLDLRNIEDVKSEMNGIIATSMSFGDLSVQSAASNREFIITSIYKPFEVRDRLNEAIVTYERKHPKRFVEMASKPE